MDRDINEEEVEQAGLNFVPCVAWIRRGVAKLNPEKVELSKEELQALIGKTKEELANLDEEGNEKEEDEDIKDNEEDHNESEDMDDDEKNASDEDVADKEMDQDARIAAEYGLDTYDDDDDQMLMGMESLAVFSDEKEDPYVTNQGASDSEEDEDFNLLPTDNLIAVGHVEGDAAILEIYVYNAEEAHLYVHHETLLPALPLCMEWLDFSPGEDKPGNYLAVGNMSPIIEVWDVDLVGSIEPEFKLGKKRNKKKKIAGVGHTDAVISLSWNNQIRNLLASGSADHTAMLWDMSQQAVATTLNHPEKVQSLQFHPFEIQTLLTGSCDERVRVYDCRSESFKSWKVEGEVERVLWDHFNPYYFLTATESGHVYYVDVRNDEKPVWQLNAHTKACTGIALSTQCPGCLVTVSQDKSFKVWDVLSGKPSFIVEHDFKLGNLYTAAACPDAPFAFCMGGDNRSDNFKVWDIRQSAAVLDRFEKRQLVQPLIQTGEVKTADQS